MGALGSILVILVTITVVVGLILYQRVKESPYDARLIRRFKRTVYSLVGIIVLLLLSTQLYIFVPPGYGVVAYNWFTDSYKVYDDGFHIIFRPLYELTRYDVRKQAYTMTLTPAEGAVQGQDEVTVMSRDNLEMGIDITLLYYYDIKNLDKLHREIRYPEEKIVRPKTRNVLRDVFARYEATEAAAVKRDEIQREIFRELADFFAKNYIILEDVQLREIRLPELVRTAIEEKKREQQEAEKMEYTIQVAEKKREVNKLEGQAEAQKRIEVAKGEAEAIRIINEELSKSPQYLKWMAVDKLNPNAKIVITDSDTILDLGTLSD